MKLLSLGVVAAASGLLVMPSSQWYRLAASQFPHEPALRIAIGAILVALAAFAFVPLPGRRRRKKTISFPGQRGAVVIHLDSIEASLNRVVAKLNEVRKVNILLHTVDEGRKVRVDATVTLRKDAGLSAQETANRIRNYIADTAVNILGVEEVTTVDLSVRGIIVDLAAATTLDAELAPVTLVSSDDAMPEIPPEPELKQASEPEPDEDSLLPPLLPDSPDDDGDDSDDDEDDGGGNPLLSLR